MRDVLRLQQAGPLFRADPPEAFGGFAHLFYIQTTTHDPDQHVLRLIPNEANFILLGVGEADCIVAANCRRRE